MMVELKNGETLNGHLVQCDTWMNLTLREVVQTSPDGDKFMRLPEIYVKGNNVRIPSFQSSHMAPEYIRPLMEVKKSKPKPADCSSMTVDQIPPRSRRSHRPGQGATAATPTATSTTRTAGRLQGRKGWRLKR